MTVSGAHLPHTCDRVLTSNQGATGIEITLLSNEQAVVEAFLKIIYRPADALEEQPALGTVSLERETKLFALGERESRSLAPEAIGHC